MIDTLKPYPAYKGSGVACLGEVPEHWEVRRLKTVARVVMGQSPASRDCNVTGVGRPFLQGCAEFGQDHPVPKQYCPVAPKSAPKGALLLSVRAPVGRTNVADQEYGIGRGLCAVVPGPLLISTEMARYLVEVTNVQLFSVSTGSTYDAVSAWQVGGTLVPVATLADQSAIVRFLDHADRRIRRYIRVKKKLIALLNEQRQAIVHRVVTRGLDPNVRLKPSGVEWLGDVPEHWEVWRAKRLFREVDTRSTTGTEVLLSLRMHRGLLPHNEVSQVPITPSALVGFKRVAPGQIVMNRMRAAIGMFGVVTQPGLVSPDYAVFEPGEAVDPDYFLQVFKTRAAGTVFRLESKGLGTGSSGFMRLYTDRFGIIKLPVPPPEEQRAIVQGIAVETAEIDRTAGRINREIDLLREYRTRLIADMATGKLDVREAAARLPDEAEEPEALDETEELAEGEDVPEDADLETVSEEAET